MITAKEYVTDIFEKNENKLRSIVTKNFIATEAKKNRLFFKNKWNNNWKVLKYLLYRLCFGLKSGITFGFDNFKNIPEFSLILNNRVSTIEDKYMTISIDKDVISFDQLLKNNHLEYNHNCIYYYSPYHFHFGDPYGGLFRDYDSKIFLEEEDFSFLKYFVEGWLDIVKQHNQEIMLVIEEQVNEYKLKHLKDLNIDINGNIELPDLDSFNHILAFHQKKIIEIDKKYINDFVKISVYLKTKKENIQKIYQSLNDSKSHNEIEEYYELLRAQIHIYELLLFHSINMLTSLIDGDFIIFYEIRDCLDQLSLFNSNWENELSNKLSDINIGIKDLIQSISQMENSIVNSVEKLSYITRSSINNLNMSVNKHLNSIESKLSINNLLTSIQTYQTYRVNKNTSHLS